MKLILKLIIICFLISGIIFLSISISDLFDSNKKLNIRNIKGKVFYKFKNVRGADWLALDYNVELNNKIILKTAFNAQVDIGIGNSGIIRVKENTELGILKINNDSETYINNTAIKLNKGALFAKLLKSEKKYKNNSFVVQTPTLSCGVRGTSFYIEIPEKNKTELLLNDGALFIDKINKKFIEPLLIDKPIKIKINIDSIEQLDLTESNKKILSELTQLNASDYLNRLSQLLLNNKNNFVGLISNSLNINSADLAFTISTTRIEMSNISKSIETYYIMHNKLPENLNTFKFKNRVGLNDTQDPWNTDYKYEILKSNIFRLTSAGPDKKFNTSDDITIETICGDY